MLRSAVATFTCAGLLLTGALRAQDPDKPETVPAGQQRGISGENAFRFSEIDSINLFNGNLTLTIPLGTSYPVGGGLSYGFTLVYNSNAWDYERLCEFEPSAGGPGRAVTIYNAVPNRLSNAGVGWTFSFGRILPILDEYRNPTKRIVYAAPDGSRHSFFEGLNYGAQHDARYTNDGSYIRWRESPANCFDDGIESGSNCAVLLDFPDGSVHTFKDQGYTDGGALRSNYHSEWRMVTMADPFGNQVWVDYEPHAWTITDSATLAETNGSTTIPARTHTVTFLGNALDLQGPEAYPRIDTISLGAFGGPAIYDFDYETTEVARHDFGGHTACDPGSSPSPQYFDADLLTRITMPEGLYYELDYYTATTVDSAGNLGKAGVLRSARIPTGGAYAWEYGIWRFLDPNRFNGASPGGRSWGVIRKHVFPDARVLHDAGGDPVNLVAESDGDLWTYEHSWSVDGQGNPLESPWDDYLLIHDPQDPDPDDEWLELPDPCFYLTKVTDPLMNYTNHYFVGARDGFRRHYGLPYAPCSPVTGVLFDLNHDGEPDVELDDMVDPEAHETPAYFLSKEIFDASHHRLRSEFVTFESDPFGTRAPFTLKEVYTDYNNRQSRTRVRYWDDIKGSPPAPATRDMIHSDWDELGHFRHTRVDSDFGGHNEREQLKRYNPNCNGYPSCSPPAIHQPWLLNTYNLERANQASANHNETVDLVSCFDPVTGFLKGTRARVSSVGDGSRDIVTIYTPSGAGQVAREDLYGGDDQDLGSHTGCTNAPGGTPAYSTRHEYRYGVLEVSMVRDRDGSDFLRTAAHLDSETGTTGIDKASGLIVRSEDAAGIGTWFEYDKLNRLSRSTTDDRAVIFSTYSVADAVTGGYESTLETTACPPGSSNLCTDANVILTQTAIVADGLGRMIREKTRVAGGSAVSREVARDTEVNILGWPLHTTVWYWPSGSNPNPAKTIYSDHDAFGRPGTVRNPSGQTVSFSYLGDRVKARTVGVALLGGEFPTTSEEYHDAHGRLFAIREQLAGGERITTYDHDAAGNIHRVCVNNGGLNTTACPSGGQLRYFWHDGRGFQHAETHPELFSTSDDPSYRYRFDARGNIIERDAFAEHQLFDLDYTYDSAGRMTQVSGFIEDPASGDPVERLLKEFFYSRSNDPGQVNAGKIYQAKRHNWVHLESSEPDSINDVVVTETFGLPAWRAPLRLQGPLQPGTQLHLRDHRLRRPRQRDRDDLSGVRPWPLLRHRHASLHAIWVPRQRDHHGVCRPRRLLLRDR